MADDDADDCLLAEHALAASNAPGTLFCVKDGVELMDYLLGRGKFNTSPPPAVILLDLNMPRMDGREALKEIRAIPEFKRTPIVVFTTSKEERDVLYSRKMGANCFITKPSVFQEWIQMMDSLVDKCIDRSPTGKQNR